MAFVVCEPCVGCKNRECAEVCPCDTFRDAGGQLVIHPDLCIDCDACTAACPTGAIFAEWDVPEKWRKYIDLNATLARSEALPVVKGK